MQYLGGKTRIAKHIAAIINANRDGRTVWDAFCGGLSVSVALGGRVVASDNNEALISTYKATKAGWIPPDSVSEDDYHAAKSLPDSDPLKAFIGFGCSFGGKWFGGYARTNPNRDYQQNYCLLAKNHIITNTSKLTETHHIDFLGVEPRPTSVILYLDPPYRGTTGYRYTFDHDRFYERVLQWSRYTDVFVSEYDLPIGVCVWSKSVGSTVSLQAKHVENGSRVERLYHVRNV